MIEILGNPVSKSNTLRFGKGRAYKSKEAKQYEQDFLYQYPKHKTIEGKFQLYLELYIDGRKDLDGCLKIILDCLEDAGAISNDKNCIYLEVRKINETKNKRIRLKLTEL